MPLIVIFYIQVPDKRSVFACFLSDNYEKLFIFLIAVEAHPLRLPAKLLSGHIGFMVSVLGNDAFVPPRPVIHDLSYVLFIPNFENPFFPETEEIIGVLETNELHDVPVIDELAHCFEILTYPRNPGEIGSEKEFLGKPEKIRKILQEILGRKP